MSITSSAPRINAYRCSSLASKYVFQSFSAPTPTLLHGYSAGDSYLAEIMQDTAIVCMNLG